MCSATHEVQVVAGDRSGANPVQCGSRGAAASKNVYCRRCDRSVSANNISQRFVFSSVYQLPFGRHGHFGSSWNRYVDALLGGWQANGTLTFQTGFALNVVNGANNTL